VRYLQLTLAPGEQSIHPLFPVMADSPFVEVARMLDWNVARAETTTTLFRIVGDPEPLRDAVAATEVVLDFEVTPLDGRESYAYIHTEATDTERALWLAFNQEQSLLVPPLVYRDGTVTCRILGTSRELRGALGAVPEGIEASVERVSQFRGSPDGVPAALTDRQEAVVRAASEVGYYEVPREATAADVGERLGCSPGTASEHLRKAEARLVEAFLDG
jgi:predicted DNA binding protein